LFLTVPIPRVFGTYLHPVRAIRLVDRLFNRWIKAYTTVQKEANTARKSPKRKKSHDFLGKLIAVALVGFGILNIGVGLWIAKNTPTMVENAQLSVRYLATENSGVGIDWGTIMVGIGVVFGLLTRIANGGVLRYILA
jgi:hypothetical protein